MPGWVQLFTATQSVVVTQWLKSSKEWACITRLNAFGSSTQRISVPFISGSETLQPKPEVSRDAFVEGVEIRKHYASVTHTTIQPEDCPVLGQVEKRSLFLFADLVVKGLQGSQLRLGRVAPQAVDHAGVPGTRAQKP